MTGSQISFLRRSFIFCFVFSFVFFLNFNFSFAQEASISQFPDSPREGEEVKLTLSSDKYNLDVAKITWSIDGKEYDSGIGRKTLNIKASENGLAQIILVNIEQEGFNSAQVQKAVAANTNFILYEGIDSYVPSFYKGRRLPSRESTLRAGFFSFKDGNVQGIDGNSSDKYTWRVNGEEKTDLSGINKIANSIATKVTDRDINIRIIKEDTLENRNISEITVPLQTTEVVVYKTDEKKLLKQVLSDTEYGKKIYLLVEPFFFSVSDKSDNRLHFTWKINNVETKIDKPWSVVFSAKERDTVKINLDINNDQKITQDNSRGFTFIVE